MRYQYSLGLFGISDTVKFTVKVRQILLDDSSSKNATKNAYYLIKIINSQLQVTFDY